MNQRTELRCILPQKWDELTSKDSWAFGLLMSTDHLSSGLPALCQVKSNTYGKVSSLAFVGSALALTIGEDDRGYCCDEDGRRKLQWLWEAVVVDGCLGV